MNASPTVLVVEDDGAMRELLEDELREAGFQVVTAADGAEALSQLKRFRVDALVSDLQMPGMKGRDLLDRVRRSDPDIPVVIITAFGSIDTAVEAIKAGAYHFVSKPFRMDELISTLRVALVDREDRQELDRLQESAAARPEAIVAVSVAMQKTMDEVRRAAAADTPVILQGESGTGKELLARTLHDANPRRKGPFIAVNCSAIPENLLESQLFGHRRGSFTDAHADRVGLFQEASGGTVFLDEIGDMPLALQGKLLRVLQEKEVHPLGAPAPVPIDVRILAATHRDLDAIVESGRFRQDLYYRLGVIVIRIPPLREREGDLLPLIAHFLKKHGTRLGRSGLRVSPEALNVMRHHPWPGNIRELENCIERALVMGRSPEVGVGDLPDGLTRLPQVAVSDHRPVAQVERDHILKTLRSVNGNKAAAARLLGVDRKTLYRKLRQYELDS